MKCAVTQLVLTPFVPSRVKSTLHTDTTCAQALAPARSGVCFIRGVEPARVETGGRGLSVRMPHFHFLGGTTCLVRLVEYATLFAPFEEHVCYTSSVRQVFFPDSP